MVLVLAWTPTSVNTTPHKQCQTINLNSDNRLITRSRCQESANSGADLLKMSTISLDEEVRLFTNNSEREKYNLLGTLYGIIIALDYLERAYVRDAITAAQ